MKNEFNTVEITNNQLQKGEFNSIHISNQSVLSTRYDNTVTMANKDTPKIRPKPKISLYQMISTFVVCVVATVSVVNVADPTFLPSIIGDTAEEIVVTPSSKWSGINYTYVYDEHGLNPEIKFTFDYKDDLGYWSDYMLVIYHEDITSHAWNGKNLTPAELENGKVVIGYGGTVGNFRFAMYAATTDPKYEGASIFTYTTDTSQGEPKADQLVKFAGYDSTPRALVYITPVISLLGG